MIKAVKQKQQQFNTTYSQSRVNYLQQLSKAREDGQKEPNIIDVILEPFRQDVFKPNGKFNWFWVLWNIGKLLGAFKAALDERQNQRANEQRKFL